MKGPLLILGIFCLTGCLIALAWSRHYAAPGDAEASLTKNIATMQDIIGRQSDVSAAMFAAPDAETLKKWSDKRDALTATRTDHQQFAQNLSLICMVFSALSFLLAEFYRYPKIAPLFRRA